MIRSPVRSPIRSAISGVFERRASGGAAFVFPLDEAGALPLYAYADRKLTASYAGPGVRVLRVSDSAELDIGFDVGGLLDAAALDSFLGAELGRVVTYYDQTGNGFHAVQTTPADRPYVANLLGVGPRVVSRAGNMVVPAGVSGTRRLSHMFAVSSAYSSNLSSGIMQFGSSATSTNNCILFTASAQLSGYRLVNGVGANTAFKTQNRDVLVEASSSATGVYLAQNEESTTAAAAADIALTGGFVGGAPVLGATFNGEQYMRSCIQYGRILSVGERAALRAALYSSFGIASAPANRVIWEGDSITAAEGVQTTAYNGFVKQAIPTLPALDHYSTALGGDQLQNEIPNYANEVGALLTQYGSGIVFLFLGTNDLTLGSRTSAQIYADLQTMCGSIRANSGEVIVTTLLPNNAWNGTQQTTRNDFNTLVRTNWASFADGLADFAADATMGPQAAAANTALYPDGLHPSPLGHSYLAPIAAAAVQALL